MFYDLNRSQPSRLDLFGVTVDDGRGHTLHQRLFVVETAQDGAVSVRQPTLFLDLIPAPEGILAPDGDGLPERGELEAILYRERLNDLLAEVQAERLREIDTVSQHVEISLGALIDRQNLRLAELIVRQQEGDNDPLLAANLKQAEERLDTLEARRARRRAELQQERHCTIADIRHYGASWVLPHPDRGQPHIAPMVRDDAVERIAMDAAIAYETARGWVVEDVSADYKDKAGKSWPVEIEDLLPWPLLEAFITQYPDAVEERFQRGDVHKVVIQGKPLEQDGQVFDFKMMLSKTVRQRAAAADLVQFVDLLAKARKCMALKDSSNSFARLPERC